MRKVIQAKYGHLRAFNPVATLLILTTLLSEFCILCTATGSVTTARDHHFDSFATATGDVTTQGLSFRRFSYGYWRCYYA